MNNMPQLPVHRKLSNLSCFCGFCLITGIFWVTCYIICDNMMTPVPVIVSTVSLYAQLLFIAQRGTFGSRHPCSTTLVGQTLLYNASHSLYLYLYHTSAILVRFYPFIRWKKNAHFGKYHCLK